MVVPLSNRDVSTTILCNRTFPANVKFTAMSLQVRINNVQEKRSAVEASTRRLLRLGNLPNEGYQRAHVCDAIDTDDRPCEVSLAATSGDPWCPKHHQEWRDLNVCWSKAIKDAEKIIVTSSEVAKQKVIQLRLSVDLRRQIRDRFYPRGGDIQDYIKWIAKLETDIRQVADSLLMQNLNRGPTPETPAVETPHPDNFNLEKILILQSPLDPKIPIDSLQNMPDDGAILVLKHFYIDLCAESIRRLYTIAPDLNDTSQRSTSPNTKEPYIDDSGTDIIRTWFRVMVLNDSEAASLEHATRSRSIDQFLQGCLASQLEMYCDFFEKAWRPHAVQYLRVAVCAQTLAGSDLKTMQFLGGIIPSSTEGLQMTKSCWDILHRWFPSLLSPWSLASICSNFEDYTTICKLLMLRLYNEHWLDHGSILNECTTGVYLGFIPTSKGDFSGHAGLRKEGQLWIQRQSRNYLCGQMAIGHPLTQAFLDEMRRRKERLYLVVYEGTNADATVHPAELDLFVSRHRSAMTYEELQGVRYSINMTLDDLKNQLRRGKETTYDPIVVDSWQFIIIDRDVGRPFQLMDIVQDALLMLVGDPSPRQVARRVIREVIPPAVQDVFMEGITVQSSAELRYAPPLDVQYESNRYRSWNPEKSIVASNKERMASDTTSRDTNRFIRRVVEDMERCGLISLAPEYEPIQARPIIIRGEDGIQDLYFPYKENTMVVEGEAVPSLTIPPTSCLVEFAQAYEQKHSDAVFAKGSIATHYCAWPMPAIKSMGQTAMNFATLEGHVYHWNAMPFDRPNSANAWQYYIQHYINSRFPYVMFYLTTFVICATDHEDATRKTTALLDEIENRGWRVMLPRPRNWTRDISDLKLDKLFEGVRPS